MNERIKQLAMKVGMTDDKFGMFFAKNNHNEDGVDLELFAELIVQECIDLLPDACQSNNGCHASWVIKEHFGVEE